jgi:HEAT repeat protein/beta-lactamase regulating signal transducer with metallopeptidase domain
MMSQAPGTLAMMLDAAWRVTLLLSLAWAVARLLGGQPAARRHAIWATALSAALAVPLLGGMVPSWRLAVLPAAESARAVLPVPNTAPASRPVPPPRHRENAAALTALLDAERSHEPAASPSSSGPTRVAGRAPADWIGLIWVSVAAAVLGRYFASIASVRWLIRDGDVVRDQRWRDACDVAAAELGLSRTPALRASDHVTVPFTSGVLRPVVVVPASALSTWSDQRVRVVLLHELAHVRRRDCLVQAVTQLACAAYWFNPLTWVAARRLRAERERACDDLVLDAGMRGADYAQHLLDIARTVTPRRSLSAAALAMARPSELEGRLLAILDSQRARRRAAAGASWRTAAAVAALVLPLSTVQPVAREVLSMEPGSRSPGAVETASPTAAAAEPEAEQDHAIDAKTAARIEASAAATAAPVAETVARAVVASAGSVSTAVVTGVADGIAAGVSQGIPGGIRGGIPGGIRGGIAGGIRGGIAGGVIGGLDFEIEQTDKPNAGRTRTTASPEVIAGLTEALKDTDAEVRKHAMQALTRLGAPLAYDALIAALKDEDAEIREQAAFSLGQSGDKRAVAALGAALKDAEPDVRQQAAFALSQLGAAESVPALRAALKDEDEDVREQALFALTQLGDKASTPAIAEALKDPSEDVREQALFALSQLGDPSAVPAILPVLAKDESDDVRQQAAFALSQIGDERAVSALTAALKDPSPDVRRQAIFALSQIAGGDDDDDDRERRRGRSSDSASPTPTPSPTPAPNPQNPQ